MSKKRYDEESLQGFAQPNDEDEFGWIEKLAKECLYLRSVIRSIHVVGTTSEDANEFVMETIDACEAERRAWGEDPDKEWREKEVEDERRDAEAREAHDKAKLAELKAKYPEES